MAGCENLCTAAKCQELENRINDLEGELRTLKERFESHLNQDIPIAHNYNSNLRVEAFLNSKELGISISDVTSNDTASVNIPFCSENECQQIEEKIDSHIGQDIPQAHGINCDLSIEAFYTGGGLGISLSSCFGSDTTSVNLPYCTVEKCQEIESKLDDHLNQDIPQAHKIDCDLNLNAFYSSQILTISLNSCFGSDSTSVFLPSISFSPPRLDIRPRFNFNPNFNKFTFSLDIDTGETSGSAEVDFEMPPVTIDGFVQGKELNLILFNGNRTDTASIRLPFCFDNECEELRRDLDIHINTDAIFAHPN
ncbi:hypothetical protein IQ238_29210, partial [Pleurocapsales cyanobacterium LEGE 06147]|nr:hypothetical protein [Pleurocapsales cyanobacterium LEGE 06147]